MKEAQEMAAAQNITLTILKNDIVGVQYSWGQAKSVYKRAKLAEKKRKESFHRLVVNCLSAEEGAGKDGLTPDMIRKFS